MVRCSGCSRSPTRSRCSRSSGRRTTIGACRADPRRERNGDDGNGDHGENGNGDHGENGNGDHGGNGNGDHGGNGNYQPQRNGGTEGFQGCGRRPGGFKDVPFGGGPLRVLRCSVSLWLYRSLRRLRLLTLRDLSLLVLRDLCLLILRD